MTLALRPKIAIQLFALQQACSLRDPDLRARDSSGRLVGAPDTHSSLSCHLAFAHYGVRSSVIVTGINCTPLGEGATVTLGATSSPECAMTFSCKATAVGVVHDPEIMGPDWIWVLCWTSKFVSVTFPSGIAPPAVSVTDTVYTVAIPARPRGSGDTLTRISMGFFLSTGP